jgi:hypothetical protein
MDMTATAIVVVTLVVLGFGAYLFLMIFYPEWVGITGEDALKNMREHEEGSKVDDSDIFSSERKQP